MRESVNFNRDWQFHLGNDLDKETMCYGNQVILAFEDNLWQKAGNHGISRAENPYTKDWRTVQVPHDYALEGPFSPATNSNNGGLEHGEAWYVKRFELEKEDEGRVLRIEFDGVYRNCTVFVNGFFMGNHMSGYTPFAFDITDVCFFDRTNCIAVYVDPRENELWSYEGAGIYREVRLVKTAKVAVAHWGTYVTTGGEEEPGLVKAEITVDNKDYSPVSCRVTNRVLDGNKVLAETIGELTVTDWDKGLYKTKLSVDSPVLWKLDDPKLYTLETVVEVDGKETDCHKTPFGFRYFKFDPDQGFFLNGESMKLKGVCLHQDHGCVGTAVPPALHEWRVRKMKEMGANAIRMSHNQADPALLDACDRAGMLVMDEARMGGTCPEILKQLEDMIMRGRNHPSIIFWSVGNEEMNLQPTPHGRKMLQRMTHLARRLDPSRAVTYAMNANWDEVAHEHGVHREKRFDVFGFNYLGGAGNRGPHNFDNIHRAFPDWPKVQTESWGGTATRDQYEPETPIIPTQIKFKYQDDDSIFKFKEHTGFITEYGDCQTPWGNFVEETWKNCMDRPFLSGTFYWTGMDYRGEVFPYDWPAVVTRFGLVDLCGYFKAPAHYLKTWWHDQTPNVYVMPHWDWLGHEGKEKRVWVYANTARVELFLNGKSLGKKEMPRLGKLEWMVPFEPGLLEARGLDDNDKQIADCRRATSGAPNQIGLESERLRLEGYEDLMIVHVRIEDKEGHLCHRAENLVEFEVDGPAEIIGVGNGNPISHEPDLFTSQRQAFHGLCQVMLRQKPGGKGQVKIKASSWDLESCEIEIA